MFCFFISLSSKNGISCVALPIAIGNTPDANKCLYALLLSLMHI